MTVNEKIVQALTPFGIPIKTDFHVGHEDEYFTFNYADDRAVDFGDDGPLHVVAYMQIHWFLPRCRDFLEMKNKVRNALFRVGFTYPEITVMTENDIRHVVFECEIEDDECEIENADTPMEENDE